MYMDCHFYSNFSYYFSLCCKRTFIAHYIREDVVSWFETSFISDQSRNSSHKVSYYMLLSVFTGWCNSVYRDGFDSFEDLFNPYVLVYCDLILIFYTNTCMYMFPFCRGPKLGHWNVVRMRWEGLVLGFRSYSSMSCVKPSVIVGSPVSPELVQGFSRNNPSHQLTHVNESMSLRTTFLFFLLLLWKISVPVNE